MPTVVDCPYCRGTARNPLTATPCEVCRGTGRVARPEGSVRCNYCRGGGRDPYGLSACPVCRGVGHIALAADAAETKPPESKEEEASERRSEDIAGKRHEVSVGGRLTMSGQVTVRRVVEVAVPVVVLSLLSAAIVFILMITLFGADNTPWVFFAVWGASTLVLALLGWVLRILGHLLGFQLPRWVTGPWRIPTIRR